MTTAIKICTKNSYEKPKMIIYALIDLKFTGYLPNVIYLTGT